MRVMLEGVAGMRGMGRHWDRLAPGCFLLRGPKGQTSGQEAGGRKSWRESGGPPMLDAQWCSALVLLRLLGLTALGPSKEQRAQLGIQRKEGLA